MRFLLVIVLLILICGVGFYLFVHGHGFSARGTPSALEAAVAGKLVSLAYAPGAKETRNPLTVTPAILAEAKEKFHHDCAVCHGDNGDGKTETAAGLYPKPPDLRDESDMTDGELFYIVKNGIRFTGMPGWGEPDDRNWKLVLYIRSLGGKK
ncbi:MAG: c-type cytochrome [Bryobacteraceae bacterium]